MSEEKEEKWELPEKFQLTPELLAAADEQQEKWRAENNQPFAALSPQARERGRAALIVRDPGISPAERYEAYLTLGRFDLAMSVPGVSSDLYLEALQMLRALERADDEWCAHPPKAQYVERDVFSVRHGREAHLMRCNECGFRNLVPLLPDHLKKGRERRAAARLAYGGLTPAEFKERAGGRA